MERPTQLTAESISSSWPSSLSTNRSLCSQARCMCLVSFSSCVLVKSKLQVVASVVTGPVSVGMPHDDLSPATGACRAREKHVFGWIAIATPWPIIAFHARLSAVDRGRFASRAGTRALVTATSSAANGFIRCFVVCLCEPGDSSL